VQHDNSGFFGAGWYLFLYFNLIKYIIILIESTKSNSASFQVLSNISGYFTQVEVKYDGDDTGSVFDCNTWLSKSSGLARTFFGNVTNLSCSNTSTPAR
jgi:hypothetical protein